MKTARSAFAYLAGLAALFGVGNQPGIRPKSSATGDTQPNPTAADLKSKTKPRREYFRKGKRVKRYTTADGQRFCGFRKCGRRNEFHPGEYQPYVVFCNLKTAVPLERVRNRTLSGATEIIKALNSKNAIRKARNAGFLPEFDF